MVKRSNQAPVPQPKREPMVKCTMNLPTELWKQTRIRAIEEDRDAQDVVADALRAYLGLAQGGGAA